MAGSCCWCRYKAEISIPLKFKGKTRRKNRWEKRNLKWKCDRQSKQIVGYAVQRIMSQINLNNWRCSSGKDSQFTVMASDFHTFCILKHCGGGVAYNSTKIVKLWTCTASSSSIKTIEIFNTISFQFNLEIADKSKHRCHI